MFAIGLCAVLAVSSPKVRAESTTQLPAIGEVTLQGGLHAITNAFETQINNLFAQAERTGDALLDKLGDELQVELQNAELAGSNLITQAGDRVNTQQQAIFSQMNLQIGDALKAGFGGATNLMEMSKLDILDVAKVFPFTKKVNFYVEDVQNLTFIPGASQYTVNVVGLGLNATGIGYHSQVTATVAGAPVNVDNTSRANYLTITVDAEKLSRLWSARTPVRASITVNVKQTQSGIFHRKANYSFTVYAILMPNGPITLHLSEGIPSWQPLNPPVYNAYHRSHVTRSDADNNKHWDTWTDSLPVATDEVITSTTLSSVGGRDANAHLFVFGTPKWTDHLATWTITSDVADVTENIDVKTTKYGATDVWTPPKDVAVSYIQSATIHLDPKNKSGAYTLTGVDFFHQEILIANSIVLKGPITVLAAPSGNSLTVIVSLQTP